MARSNYKYTLEFVLSKDIEGGYVNHPSDPGGETNLGITKKAYESYLGSEVTSEEMKNLTIVEAAPFYKKKYWDVLSCDSLPVGIDLCVFDFGVNSGTGRSAKFLQEIVGAKIDGSIGTKTLNSLSEFLNSRTRLHNEDIVQARISFIKMFCNKRRDYLKSLRTFETFGRGWMRRVNLVEEKAIQMIQK